MKNFKFLLCSIFCTIFLTTFANDNSVVVTNINPFVINEPTTWSSVTNVYTYTNGFSKINSNLKLNKRSYIRIVGVPTKPTNVFGICIADQDTDDVTITINNDSGFYATYRPSGQPQYWVDTGIDPIQETYVAIPSYVKIFLGSLTNDTKDSSGRATIIVNGKGNYFGNNINTMGFWSEYLNIGRSVKCHDTGYIDFLQLNTKNGIADITCIENLNTNYPARILFNGGRLRHNYANNTSGPPFKPATNAVIVLEGINGNPIYLRKEYNGKLFNGGNGTIRFQGDCEVHLEEAGRNLPGIDNSNRQAYYIDPNGSQIEWNQTKSLAIIGYGFLRVGRTEGLPFRANEPDIRLRGNAILDPDADSFGHRVNLRTLISESNLTLVTNVTATYNKRNSDTATLVFGIGDTDGIFNAKCCQNINIEKVGSGLLVVSNTTMNSDTIFEAKEGSIVLVGDNKIGNENFYETENLVISNGVSVIREITINVPEGEERNDPTLYRDYDNGIKFRIRKTGGGTLFLRNGHNYFTGGLIIEGGLVYNKLTRLFIIQ